MIAMAIKDYQAVLRDLLSEIDVQRIIQQVDALQPDLLIDDTIQTVTTDDIHSPAGS